MVRMSRLEVLAADEVVVAHVFSRTVRRCFLLGTDAASGKNFDHRKLWIEAHLQHFAAAFGIDLLAYAVLSNHFHLILRTRPDVVATWDDTEVARRWLMLCPHRVKNAAARIVRRYRDGRASSSRMTLAGWTFAAPVTRIQ